MSKIPVAHGSRIPLPQKHGAAIKPGTSHIPATNPKNEISNHLTASEMRPSPVSLHEIENFQNVNREPLTDTTDSEISDTTTTCIKEVHPPHSHAAEVGVSQRRAPSNQRLQSSSSQDGGSIKSSHSVGSHGSSTTRTTADMKNAPVKSSNLASTMKKPAVVNPPPAAVVKKVAAAAPPQPPIAARTSHQQLPSSTANNNGGSKSKIGSRSTTPTYNSNKQPAAVAVTPPEKKITSRTLKAAQMMSQSSHHLLTEVAIQPIATGVDSAELLRDAMAMIDSTITDLPLPVSFALPTNLSQSDAQLEAFIDEAQYKAQDKAPQEPYAYLVQLPRLTAEIQQQVHLVTAESGLLVPKLLFD